MRVQARFQLLFLLYLGGMAATIGVLLYAAHHYTPFDSSGLVFLHPRLPRVEALRELYAAATLSWFAVFAALVLFMFAERVCLNRARIVAVLAMQASIGLLFATLPIAVDSDQFAYVGYAYAGTIENDYTAARIPPTAPEAARLAAEHWGNPLPPDRYGGLWTGINTLLLQPFADRSIAFQAAVLRVVALLAACAITIVAASFLCGRLLGTLALFSLNPLVLIETANGAHNDIFLVLAGTIALAAFLNRRFGLAGIFLGCAAALKYAYAPFIAPMLAGIYARGRSGREVLYAAAGFLAVVVLSVAPYGWRHGVIQGALLLTHAQGDLTYITPLAAFSSVVALVALTVEASRGRFPAGFAILASMFMLALTGKIEAWYVMMTAPLAFAPSQATRLAFLGFSALGIVLAQSSLGPFPLIEGLFAMLAIAAVSVAVFAPRRIVGREQSA